MIVKIVMTIGMLIALNACANDIVRVKNETIVMPPLPQKCGEYDIVYGSANDLMVFNEPKKIRDNHNFYFTFKDEKGEIISKEQVHQRYIGKTLLYAENIWHQTIGGVLDEDGKSIGIYTNTLVQVKLIEIVEKGDIDMDNLKKVCNQLKKDR